MTHQPINPSNITPVTVCLECGAHQGHCVTCSRQTLEELAAKLDFYYKAWLDLHKHGSERVARYRKEITHWQGKHALLRHENNKLRERARKLEAEQNPSTW